MERIKFSVSSRNAEAKVSRCGAHVFGATYTDDPRQIEWQYIGSGVTCILRSKERHKSGRKFVWTISLCLYNAVYGVLVWKGKLCVNSDYTAVADNFHVFFLTELNLIVGLLFTNKAQASELHKTYQAWHVERMREEKAKGSNSSPAQSQFRKEMISKPCNFQHIQGTQALDECLEIEKIKTDIQAAFFGLIPRIRTTTNAAEQARKRAPSSANRRKKEVSKPKLEFKDIGVPNTSISPLSPPLSPLQQPLELHTQLTTQSSMPLLTDHPPHPALQSEASMPLLSPPGDVSNGYHPQEIFFTSPPPPEQYGVEQYAYENQPFVASPPTPEVDQKLYAGDPYQAHTDNSYYDNQRPVDQGYDDEAQSAFAYDSAPPRMDFNLEKEFSESVAFQSTVMSAN